jgi:CheY-like chemotaxis protein
MAPAENPGVTHRTPSSAGTVVIVDDEASVRELFEGALSDRGHRVGTAGSVAEGLEVCERVNPDVVIVDIFMPERSGLELIRAVRQRSRPPRVIAVTGGGSNEDFDVLLTAKDAGAAVALRKPLPVRVLIDAVESLLERS